MFISMRRSFWHPPKLKRTTLDTCLDNFRFLAHLSLQNFFFKFHFLTTQLRKTPRRHTDPTLAGSRVHFFYEKIIFFSLWVFLLYFWSLMTFRVVRKWYLGPKFLKIGLLIIFGILGAWNFLVWSASRRIGSLSEPGHILEVIWL